MQKLTHFDLPPYVNEIIIHIMRRNWLVHNFIGLRDIDLYNPINFLHNHHINKSKYTINIDVNIFQFIVNSVKKDTKEIYRDAIALVCFCQIANIELCPSIALYEKFNYSDDPKKLNEINADLKIFNSINNANNEILASYAINGTSLQNQVTFLDHNENFINDSLTKYERLESWPSLYLIVLKIVGTSHNAELDKSKKLKHIINWMIRDYRLSLPCTIFSIVFFGKKPLKKMMKLKASDNKETKKKSLYNMTWDLYGMYHYFKLWTDKGNDEYLYASDDIAFRQILKLMISCQEAKNLTPLRGHIDTSFLLEIDQMTSTPNTNENRMYMSSHWTPDYRDRLINELEGIVGIQ